MSWLWFSPPITAPGRTTSAWDIFTKDRTVLLGCVQWGRWHKYEFCPEPHTAYDEQCLREIAAFCESRTREHKAQQAARVAALPDRPRSDR